MADNAAVQVHKILPRLGGRLIVYWRTALFGGLLASGYATAGWILFVIIQAFLIEWRTIYTLPLGPAVHLAWERGRPWVLGTAGKTALEHQTVAGLLSGRSAELGPLKWSQIGLTTFGLMGIVSLVVVSEWAERFHQIFLTSILTFFVAGVILTFIALVMIDLRKYDDERDSNDKSPFISLAFVIAPLVASVIAGAEYPLLRWIQYPPAIPIAERGFSWLSSVISPHPDFQALVWWWTPAALGFLLARKPRRSILVAATVFLVLCIAITWLYRPKAGQLTPSANGQGPPENVWLPRDWGSFDPRHFLSAISSPDVPPAFWSEADAALLEKRPITNQGPWVSSFRNGDALATQAVGRLCGCPKGLSEDLVKEAQNSFTGIDAITADLLKYEKYYGPFCEEMQLGLNSGMIRSWILLAFFALGIANAVRAKPEATVPGRHEIRQTLIVTIAIFAIFFLLAFLAAQDREPSSVELRSSAAPVNVCWTVAGDAFAA